MAHDIFIKIEGVCGESTDVVHRDEIDVIDWHWSIARFSTDDVSSRGQSRDLEFTHHIDRASPALAKYCRTGQRVPKAVLTMRYASGEPREFLRLTLIDVLVNIVMPSGSADHAIETVYLSFTRVHHEYIMRKSTGVASGTAMATLDMLRKVDGGSPY